jgi:hypothetical protein
MPGQENLEIRIRPVVERLAFLRIQLFTAMQTLHGTDLDEFWSLIDDVSACRKSSQESREKLRRLKCVQAGWAFGVPEDGREQWLDMVVAAIRETREEKADPSAE